MFSSPLVLYNIPLCRIKVWVESNWLRGDFTVRDIWTSLWNWNSPRIILPSKIAIKSLHCGLIRIILPSEIAIKSLHCGLIRIILPSKIAIKSLHCGLSSEESCKFKDWSKWSPHFPKSELFQMKNIWKPYFFYF